MNIHMKLRLGLISALVLLVLLGFVSQRRLKTSTDRTALVSHTHDVLSALDSAWASAHLAESDQRGFMLAPSNDLESGFQAAQFETLAALDRARLLLDSDSSERGQIDHLKPLLEEALAAQEAHLNAAHLNQHAAFTAYTLSAASDTARMRQIDSAFRALKQQQESLRVRSLRSSNQASSLAAALTFAGTLLGSSFVALCALWISRDLRHCEEAEATLMQVRENLESRVNARTADLSKTTASLEAEISERRNTEEQLRESERRYRLLFEDSPLAMEMFDPETLADLAVNTAAAELYG